MRCLYALLLVFFIAFLTNEKRITVLANKRPVLGHVISFDQ